MGTWGFKSFENDASLDWLSSLDQKGISLLELTFDKVLRSKTVPDSGICQAAVAAVECILAIAGQASSEVPAELTAWVNGHRCVPSSILIGKAKECLDRVLTDSELEEGWESDDDHAAWFREVEPLRIRLSKIPSASVVSSAEKPWWRFW